MHTRTHTQTHTHAHAHTHTCNELVRQEARATREERKHTCYNTHTHTHEQPPPPTHTHAHTTPVTNSCAKRQEPHEKREEDERF